MSAAAPRPDIPPPFRLVEKASPPWCANCRHRTTAAFIDLPGPDLAFMAQFKQAHAIASSGDHLVRQGSIVECAAVLYSGWVAKYRTTSTGERQLLSILLPGDLLGIETVGTRSWYSLQALTDVSVCVFAPARLPQLLGLPSLGARLLKRIAADRRLTEERFTVVAAADRRHGLAQLILDLHRRLRMRGLAPADSLSLPLTRRQLAEAVGITSVHLHRILRELREANVLRFERRRVLIVDRDRLRELALSPRPMEPQPLI
jgi:CRP/FNR family transcriptional regulator, anaerobic regulatory protein